MAVVQHVIYMTYRVLVGKPEGRRPLGRPRRKWGKNIEIDLKEGGWGGMDWIDLTLKRDRCRVFVNMVTNLWVPQNLGNFFD
jgi:hypothetical protein